MSSPLAIHSAAPSPFTRPLLWLAMLLALTGLAMPARAQLDTGSIAGVVTDPSGKVVEGAHILATGATTGTTYSAVSSSAGYYVIPSLRTGVYEVKVSVQGFRTAVYSGVTVSIGVRTAQDAALTVGSATETVNVNASALALETQTSEVDDTISSVQVADLPLQVSGTLRSLTSMEFLVPGTVGPGTSSGGSGFQMTKINGGQEEGTDYLVDGITTNRMENGSGCFDILTPSGRCGERIPRRAFRPARRIWAAPPAASPTSTPRAAPTSITDRSTTSTRTPRSMGTTGSTTAIWRRPGNRPAVRR